MPDVSLDDVVAEGFFVALGVLLRKSKLQSKNCQFPKLTNWLIGWKVFYNGAYRRLPWKIGSWMHRARLFRMLKLRRS